MITEPEEDIKCNVVEINGQANGSLRSGARSSRRRSRDYSASSVRRQSNKTTMEVEPKKKAEWILEFYIEEMYYQTDPFLWIIF